MSGSKVSEYSIGDVNLSALMTTADAQRIGYHAVSLTEYETTTIPEIAAGSKVEVNGALFKFDTDETITESPNNGDVYIKLIPDVSSITAEFTNDAPTWDDEKQGWYEAATNNRYLNYLIIKVDASYTKNKLFPESTTLKIGHDVEIENDIGVGSDMNIEGTINKDGVPIYGYIDDGTPIYAKELSVHLAGTSASVAHGITSAYSNDRIKIVRCRNIVSSNYNQADGEGASWAHYFRWDDTNITVHRTSADPDFTFKLFVVYT